MAKPLTVRLDTEARAQVEYVCDKHREESRVCPRPGFLRVGVRVIKPSKYHQEGDTVFYDLSWKLLTRWLLRGHEVPVR